MRVVAINELVDIAKKTKEYLILKVDFDKSYNSFSWRFLDYILVGFGFNDKLCP